MAQTPACQIYLCVSQLPVSKAPALLEEALLAGQAACMLFKPSAVATLGDDLTRDLIALTKRHGAVALLENDAELAERLGADGLHLTDLTLPNETIAGARGRLGDRAVIGAHAILSRHQGMICGEAGADYISFDRRAPEDDHEIGPISDIVRWWADIIEIPCVAWHRGGYDEAAELIAAGADFIAVDALIWQNSISPRDALDRLFHLTTKP
ncbi:MAG: thiamine phosphate synthase [Hyphomicrobiales bacterium]|nr:thiamine phosphate synthase [Hyphomicrobiales bacterium]